MRGEWMREGCGSGRGMTWGEGEGLRVMGEREEEGFRRSGMRGGHRGKKDLEGVGRRKKDLGVGWRRGMREDVCGGEEGFRRSGMEERDEGGCGEGKKDLEGVGWRRGMKGDVGRGEG
ncbi:hypothetical protein Pmani_036582 [Petrolisthes manimaculis]|uniref:Uncharacterized protein n=1 Tax=Petrolisthes manimaculis TaxID=1843537 RepID=A0AAE1NJV1_9EUCA|nr:hypothetical protein Pmani_036582 [Petrolisthes manimaculis]